MYFARRNAAIGTNLCAPPNDVRDIDYHGKCSPHRDQRSTQPTAKNTDNSLDECGNKQLHEHKWQLKSAGQCGDRSHAMTCFKGNTRRLVCSTVETVEVTCFCCGNDYDTSAAEMNTPTQINVLTEEPNVWSKTPNFSKQVGAYK